MIFIALSQRQWLRERTVYCMSCRLQVFVPNPCNVNWWIRKQCRIWISEDGSLSVRCTSSWSSVVKASVSPCSSHRHSERSGRSIHRNIDSLIYDLSLLSVGAWHVKHGRRCLIIRRPHVHLEASACFQLDILSILVYVGAWPCKM
jgi:hypothetical protein